MHARTQSAIFEQPPSFPHHKRTLRIGRLHTCSPSFQSGLESIGLLLDPGSPLPHEGKHIPQ